MRKFIFIAIGATVLLTTICLLPWNSNFLSHPYQSAARLSTDDTNDEELDKLWIDTIMYAHGHSFGYSGDISMWEGWYYDTVCVGDDRMLIYDSVGPSTLKLSLVTKNLIVDLGDSEASTKIRDFMQPINNFRRFQKNYEQCLDSVTDEEYGTWKYMGNFSFTVDYPDSSMENAGKINRFICELTGISELEKAKVPELSASFAGFKQTKNYRPAYTSNANEMQSLSDFLAHRTFENWIRGGELDMGSSGATLAIKPCIANERFITFSVYEYDRVGTGHGMYTETFHTFDILNEKELINKDIFKSQYLDKVKTRLFEVMANDPHYRAWNGDSISASDIQSRIEGWQSPDQISKGTENRTSNFELPDGALTSNGVVFSFQPYEIDCWAAGAYHFIVPYKKLLPFMTQKAQRLILN